MKTNKLISVSIFTLLLAVFFTNFSSVSKEARGGKFRECINQLSDNDRNTLKQCISENKGQKGAFRKCLESIPESERQSMRECMKQQRNRD